MEVEAAATEVGVVTMAEVQPEVGVATPVVADQVVAEQVVAKVADQEVVMPVAAVEEADEVALQAVAWQEASDSTAVQMDRVMRVAVEVAAEVAQMVVGSHNTSCQCKAKRRYEPSRCCTSRHAPHPLSMYATRCAPPHCSQLCR